MPDHTANLNLPLPLGNENVNRQFFIDLINAIDEGAVSEEEMADAISKIAIAMIDEFTSTDKTKAPTADALRRGLETKQNTVRLSDNWLAASVLVNAAPDAQGRVYPDGLSFFKVSSSAGAWPTANGYVVTMRAGSGGFQLYFEMYTGNVQTDKTARFWTRSKRDSNTFWQDWSRVLTEVDMTAHANDHIRHPLYAPAPTGTGTLYTVQTNPAEGISTIPDGFGLVLVPNVSNTGAASVKIDTATTVPLKTADETDFAIGELRAGVPVMFRKAGANFIASSGGGRAYPDQQKIKVLESFRTTLPTAGMANRTVYAMEIHGDFVFVVAQYLPNNQGIFIFKINKNTGAIIWSAVIATAYYTQSGYVEGQKTPVILDELNNRVGFVVVARDTTANKAFVRLQWLNLTTGAEGQYNLLFSFTPYLGLYEVGTVYDPIARRINIASAQGGNTVITTINIDNLSTGGSTTLITGSSPSALGITKDGTELYLVAVGNSTATYYRVRASDRTLISTSNAYTIGSNIPFNRDSCLEVDEKGEAALSLGFQVSNGVGYVGKLSPDGTWKLDLSIFHTPLGFGKGAFSEGIFYAVQRNPVAPLAPGLGGRLIVYNPETASVNLVTDRFGGITSVSGGILIREGDRFYIGQAGYLLAIERPYYERKR